MIRPTTRTGNAFLSSFESLVVIGNLEGLTTHLNGGVENDIKKVSTFSYRLGLYQKTRHDTFPFRRLYLSIVENEEVFLFSEFQFTVAKRREISNKREQLEKFDWEEIGESLWSVSIKVKLKDVNEMYELIDLFNLMGV